MGPLADSPQQLPALHSVSHGVREGVNLQDSPRLPRYGNFVSHIDCLHLFSGAWRRDSAPLQPVSQHTQSGKRRRGREGEALYFYSLWIYKVPLPAGGADSRTHPQRSQALEVSLYSSKPFKPGGIYFPLRAGEVFLRRPGITYFTAHISDRQVKSGVALFIFLPHRLLARFRTGGRVSGAVSLCAEVLCVS